jgi:hypothetical protein
MECVANTSDDTRFRGMNMTVLWVIAPYSFVEIDRRFRGTYCLRHQGDEVMHRPDDGGSTYL